MNRALHYRISNWSQIVDCLSNNSRNLYLSVQKIIDKPHIKGQLIQVNHPKYGTLFAAMTDGYGELITEVDEEGNLLPFLTTDEILKQLAKFGFYIEYNVQSNLPSNIIDLLQTLYELDYDKITKVLVRATTDSGIVWRPQIIVMKTEFNTDLLSFGCKITDNVFKQKLAENTIMNLTYEKDMKWDWLTYMANISDILDENIDPVDSYETETDVEEGTDPWIPPMPPGFTPYEDPEDDDEEDTEGDTDGE